MDATDQTNDFHNGADLAMVEHMLDGFVRIDHRGIIVDWNRQAENVLGWHKSETIGKPAHELIVPAPGCDDRDRMNALFSADQISKFVNRRLHIQAQHRLGHTLRIELTLISFPVGKDTQFGAFMRDITALTLAEDKLRQSEEQYRSLVENAPDTILIIDRDFKISFINRLVSGHSRDQVIGKSSFLFIPEHDHERVLGIYKSIFATRKPCTFETQGIHVDGQRMWYDSNASPIFSGDEVVGITILTRNVTAMKLAQEELKNHHEQLIASAKLSSLGEMAAGIAHEINNPLSIIYGLASQTKKKQETGTLESERLASNLSTILATTERIAKIVRGLRTFSRDVHDDPLTPTAVAQIIEDTLELCKEKFRFHSIDLQIDYKPESVIDCRPAQISQVLMNLLNNAYDAVETLDRKWIQVNAIERDNVAVITVTDSGSGIPIESRHKIMLPFFTTKSIGRGTGLGLSISTGIAEGHGGKLYYDDTHAHTRFVLELPLSKQALSPVD